MEGCGRGLLQSTIHPYFYLKLQRKSRGKPVSCRRLKWVRAECQNYYLLEQSFSIGKMIVCSRHMYICIYVRMHAHMQAYVCTHVRRSCALMYACMYFGLNICMQVCGPMHVVDMIISTRKAGSQPRFQFGLLENFKHVSTGSSVPQRRYTNKMVCTSNYMWYSENV